MKAIMKHHFRENATYFMVVFGLILILLCFEIIYGKQALFLQINAFHTPLLDYFFQYITHLGDGLFFILIAFLLLFIKKGWAVTGFVCYLITSILAQFLKKVIFTGTPRPIKYFEELGINIRTIEGLEVHSWNSFPSGHTITAFAISTFLVLLFRFKKWQYVLAFSTFIIAFSRIYLAQHFLIDVIFGAFLGVVFTFLTYTILYFYLHKKSWFDKPLF